MSDTAAETSLHLEIVVHVPQQHAFTVFTEQLDQIKPHEYNLLEAEIAETVFEPRVGGHVYDRGVDGSICRWARVLAFDPPERFVISWDIDASWQLETDPARASEVEVRFVPLGSASTRVELYHRHLDRHGTGWEHLRGGLAAEDGWPVFLDRFTQLVAAP